MRLVSLLAIFCALSACASPPPPPECEGDFRPVNIQQKGVTSLSHKASLALCAGGNVNGKA